MKKLLIICCIIFTATSVFAESDTLINQASTLYSEGKYRDAAEVYENLLAQDRESHELYYNLGNAYYKLGENTKAIINYERALLINPSDKDTRYNLRMAQKKIVDKLEVLPELFFIRWYKLLVAYFSADQWAIISLIFFILFLVALAVFLYSSSVGAKKAGFGLSIFALVITLMTLFFTLKQNKKVTHRDSAIIITPSVTVKGAPDSSGTDLFVIHEGLKVTIKDSLRDWYNIRLQDGNEGWVSREDLERI